YPIAKAYADARVSRIYAGSSEIMKTIIAKELGL
ncbi:MAG: acyl-CoA dehydrogenase, partial [Mycobacterium sp.]|nr:acyl-CoA dehydrogenase [Mycobacterium sp.]